MRKTRRSLTILLLTAFGLIGGVGLASADPPAPPGTPTAVSFNGVPAAGALFLNGLDNAHSCSASVVRSPGRDLVITAAHCISGTGAGVLFAPGYHDGKTPFGVWTVQKAWVSPTWIASQDPHNDYAFLQIAPRSGPFFTLNVQDVVGGFALGTAARAGTPITDVAYPYGVGGKPIVCTARLGYTSGYPTFNCNGYPGGTSGSPFLAAQRGRTPTVTGVIGGLHQGGCYLWNSFSSPFGAETLRTYQRAVQHKPADQVPEAGSDGC